MRRKMLFYFFTFACLMFNFASSTSTHKVKRSSPLNLRTFVMVFNQKIDLLTERVDQIDAKINKLINKIEQKIEKFEEKLNKIEKIEEKMNRMDLTLSQLKDANIRENENRDKMATWVNSTTEQLKANLDQINFCIENKQKPLMACHPNPCLHGGKCQLSSTESGFKCTNCPKRTSGSRCENVECSVMNRCWRLNDTLYVVIETNVTWADVKLKCESEGMALVMPKNEESTLFLKNQLKPIYKTHPYNYLWMGLKRDEGGSQEWYWVDGSFLGEYRGGWVDWNNNPSLMFVLLSLNDVSVRWWRGNHTWRVYPICEMQLSTT